jgi:hypothetical protein
MPTTPKVAAPEARGAAPGAVSTGATATAGGTAAGPAAAGGAGTTAGPAGGTVGVAEGTLATSATSEFGVLGWFTVDAEGATVQFGIDQQQYFLDASAANYNALFAMLLACWLEPRKVDLTYAITRVVSTAPADAPRRILALEAI